MAFFDCTADLVGQLDGNGQKGMVQIDAPPVENFWLRHWVALMISIHVSPSKVPSVWGGSGPI